MLIQTTTQMAGRRALGRKEPVEREGDVLVPAALALAWCIGRVGA